jgi:hypothetical protein
MLLTGGLWASLLLLLYYYYYYYIIIIIIIIIYYYTNISINSTTIRGYYMKDYK